MLGRILVVDDVLPNIRLLTAKLSGSYDTLMADHGEAAIENAQKMAPDLILLDVMMPGIDGFEVCRRLKSDPVTAAIPVAMVTALSDSSDKKRALSSGAEDFICKPVRDVHLFTRVRSLIRLKAITDSLAIRETALNGSTFTTTLPIPVEMGNTIIIKGNNTEAQVLSNILMELGYKSTIVASCDEAINSLEEKNYSIILLYQDLISEGEVVAYKQIRAINNTENRVLPIIFIVENEQDIVAFTKQDKAKVNDYIVRPVNREELIARVHVAARYQVGYRGLQKNFVRSLNLDMIDPVTRFYNRRYVHRYLDLSLNLAHSSGKQLSLIVIKTNNSTSLSYCELAIHMQQIRDQIRSYDLVARIEDRCFIIVIRDISLKFVESIAKRTYYHLLNRKDGSDLHKDISISLTGLKESDHSSEDILARI